jgi:hypothetical protein
MPATRNFILNKGYDLSAAVTKNRAVKMTAEETVGPVTAATDIVIGVAEFSRTAGDIARGVGVNVWLSGIAIMEAAAAITAGTRVQLVADGRATPAVGASGARILGTCTKGCTGAGQEVSVALDLNAGVA